MPSLNGSPRINSRSFSWERVSKLFGQPLNSAVMKGFLTSSSVDLEKLWEYTPIGIVSKTGAPPRDLAEVDLKHTCGVRLSFGWGSLYAGFEELGSEFVLSGIVYYAEGEDSAQGFDGSMPFGFAFLDTEPVFLAKVGRPSNAQEPDANGVYRFHRWDFEHYTLHALFLSKTLLLRRVSAFLPVKGYRPIAPARNLMVGS